MENVWRMVDDIHAEIPHASRYTRCTVYNTQCCEYNRTKAKNLRHLMVINSHEKQFQVVHKSNKRSHR